MATRQPATQGASHPPTASGRTAVFFDTHKIMIGVLIVVGLVLGISYPLARGFDERIDRQRTGYNDASMVARLQQGLVESGQPPLEFEVGPGEAVQIGTERFSPEPGNTVVSISVEGGFCVQVTNDDPDVRSWTYDSLDIETEYDGRAGGACG